MSVPNFPQFIKALNYFGAEQLRAIQEVVNRKIESLDAGDLEPVTLYTESELNARIKAANNGSGLTVRGSHNTRLALAAQQAVNVIVSDFDALENDLYKMMDICSYVAIPGLSLAVLRIQLSEVDRQIDKFTSAYRELLNTHSRITKLRSPADWQLFDSQVTDIRAGIAALLNEQESDGGELLYRMLDKHMLPKDRERVRAAQRELNTEKEAVAASAALAEKRRSLPPEQIEAMRIEGLIKWAIQQVIAHHEGKPLTNKPAADLLLDRLKAARSAGTISPTDETTVYQDLKTRLEGTRVSQSISEAMREKIAPVVWDKVTIQL